MFHFAEAHATIMFERQLHAMAYVRLFGRQDLFIRVTTNPKCAEILESLTGESFSSENPKPFEDFERWLLWLFGGLSL